MGDDYKQVHRGQKLKIPAAAWNAMLEVVQRQKAEALGRDSAPSNEHRSSGIVQVLNSTGTDLDPFAVVGIDAPIILPADNPPVFKARVALAGKVPTAEHAGRFAILLHGSPKGRISPGIVNGLTVCRVDVANAAHQFADVADGTTANLESRATGSAQILWKEDGTGLKWAIVRLGAAAGEIRWGKARHDWQDGDYTTLLMPCRSESDGTSLGLPDVLCNIVLPRTKTTIAADIREDDILAYAYYPDSRPTDDHPEGFLIDPPLGLEIDGCNSTGASQHIFVSNKLTLGPGLMLTPSSDRCAQELDLTLIGDAYYYTNALDQFIDVRQYPADDEFACPPLVAEFLGLGFANGCGTGNRIRNIVLGDEFKVTAVDASRAQYKIELPVTGQPPMDGSTQPPYWIDVRKYNDENCKGWLVEHRDPQGVMDGPNGEFNPIYSVTFDSGTGKLTIRPNRFYIDAKGHIRYQSGFPHDIFYEVQIGTPTQVYTGWTIECNDDGTFTVTGTDPINVLKVS